MRFKYILLVYLFVLSLSTIILLVAWNYDVEKVRDILFNLSTELFGAVLIFFLLNQLFPINEETFILQRVALTLNRLEKKASPFLDYDNSNEKFNFIKRLEKAKQLDVIGYSCVNLIAKFRRDLVDAIIKGTHVRIMIIKPNSPTVELMNEHTKTKPQARDLEAVESRFKLIIDDLVNSTRKPKGSFKVRYTKWIPSCSLMILNRNSDNGILKLKINSICLSTPLSDLAAHQVITKEEDKVWFDYFVSQFERIWNENPPDYPDEDMLKTL